MPVPSLSVFVLIAAAVSVRKGSMTSACSFRSSGEFSGTGRCECSDAQSDSKPRSWSATASSDGEIEYSVNHMVAPNCMIVPHEPNCEGGREEVDARCHSGAIVYEAEVDPGPVGVCPCSACQQPTGSPFPANIQAPAAGFRMLQGDPRRDVKHGDSGAA